MRVDGYELMGLRLLSLPYGGIAGIGWERSKRLMAHMIQSWRLCPYLTGRSFMGMPQRGGQYPIKNRIDPT